MDLASEYNNRVRVPDHHRIIDGWAASAEAFREIALRYADSDTDLEQKAAYVAVARG